MRLAVLATSRHPLRQPWPGGQESQTALLARGLRERGHQVVLFAAAGSDPELADELHAYPRLPPLSEVSALDPHLPEPEFLRDHAAFTAAMTQVLRDQDIDLVHNQSLHHLPLSMSPALRVPVVTTLHTPPFPWMELGVALAADRARYVCVSRAAARDWTCLPREPEIIPNGVVVPQDSPGPGGDDLVWVGRVTPEKGLDLAIAAARIAGRRLRIIGPVSDEAYADGVIRPLLGADAQLLGHLPSEQIGPVLDDSAACLVTPRWDEPFGLVAAEAMVRGTPVVAVARGGLREVVGPGGGVLVPPGDDESVATGLAAAVAQAADLDRTQVARWARRVHDLESSITRYEQFFARVLAGAA